MEHVSVRKEEKNRRRKKKEGDGVLRAVSKAEKERHGEMRRIWGPLVPVAKGIGLCVHEAYPKGFTIT